MVKKETDSQKHERQIKYIVMSMIAAFVIVIILIILMNSTKDFEYKGFTFERYKQGGDLYYLTYIKTPIKDYALALKNDPRKLDDIPVNASIVLFTNKPLYVAVDDQKTSCEYDGVSLVQLGRFLSAIGMEVKAAGINESYADEYDMDYKTCDNVEKDEMALVFLQTNETKIYQEKNNCYIVEFKECDLSRATEKFMLEVITQAPDSPK